MFAISYSIAWPSKKAAAAFVEPVIVYKPVQQFGDRVMQRFIHGRELPSTMT
jgi:hypothetical protein